MLSRDKTIPNIVFQSSVIGPTLLTIHINSKTDTCIDSKVVLDNDDKKIHASAKDFNTIEK